METDNIVHFINIHCPVVSMESLLMFFWFYNETFMMEIGCLKEPIYGA